jgi:hypothetical protein
MESNTVITIAILVFAVAGFYFLGKTLLSIWSNKGWMKGSQSGGGSSWDWEDSPCYRKCMDEIAQGTQNQYRHCAKECGLL